MERANISKLVCYYAINRFFNPYVTNVHIGVYPISLRIRTKNRSIRNQRPAIHF